MDLEGYAESLCKTMSAVPNPDILLEDNAFFPKALM